MCPNTNVPSGRAACGGGQEAPPHPPAPQPAAQPAAQPVFRGRFTPRVASPAAAAHDGGAARSEEELAGAEGEAGEAGAASAPAFPTLPGPQEDALPAVAPSDLDLCFGGPLKCDDCSEFYASEGGRCSVCARTARSETRAAPPSGADGDTPVDYDEKMVMVGAAVVGASIGALAGGLAAVVGAGAGAWAATRPDGDKVGDSARFAGKTVVSVGGQAATKAQEVGEKLKVHETAEMVTGTAERLATTAVQRAREARLRDRAANARSRLESAASSLNRSARALDAEYQVRPNVVPACAA